MKKTANRLKGFLTSPWMTAAAFVLAVVLLLSGSIGGARAALTYYSDNYSSRIQLQDIGVTLLENEKAVSWRNYTSDGTWEEQEGMLLADMLTGSDGTTEDFKIGKTYPEELKVQNTGTISQYVRVTIYKYWTDEEGNRRADLSPDMIGLRLANPDSGWIRDEKAQTLERTVLYYSRPLEAGENGDGETTVPFADALTIDGSVAAKVTREEKEENGFTTITTTYDYDHAAFCVKTEVDAIQAHNAPDAALSAWGRRISVEDGILSLED